MMPHMLTGHFGSLGNVLDTFFAGHIQSAKRVVNVTRILAVLPYVAAMVLAIVVVDLLFLRHRAGLRLVVNIGIVALFAGFYWRLLGGR
jgi:ABC-type sugar transport system permease subunit